MNVDWKTEISRIVILKQIAADHDKTNALPWHLPSLAASPDSIILAENAAGFTFSEQFKSFLSYANGWRGFYIFTDLFGTKEIVEGRSKSVLERPEVAAFLKANNISESEVISIGASDYDVDVFLYFSPNSKTLPNGVLWLANEEIDRYESFEQFFSAMLSYNSRIANRLTEQANKSKY
jgi:hypothetical protein